MSLILNINTDSDLAVVSLANNNEVLAFEQNEIAKEHASFVHTAIESLLSNRGIKIRPKENIIKGNTIILTSSSNEEASMVYDEMQHGMFTYFMLKKIQETKGNVNMQDLFNYLYFHVREKSLLINDQLQTPTLIKSQNLTKSLSEITF